VGSKQPIPSVVKSRERIADPLYADCSAASFDGSSIAIPGSDLRTLTPFRNGSKLLCRRTPHRRAMNASAALTPTTTVDPTGGYDIFDFNGSLSISNRTQLRFGIDNLLDTEPEIVGADPPNTNSSGNTYPGYYDTLGRTYYLGLKLSF
jgi:outer membrane receptor protein involved in Fe transport